MSFVAVVGVLVGARPAYGQANPPQPRPQPPPEPQPQSQTQSQRPYRGLFGGGLGDFEQALTLSMSLGGGFDSSVLIDDSTNANPVNAPRGRTQSSFGNGSASLSYSLQRGRVGLSATGGGGASFYRVLDSPITRYSGNLGGWFRISSRTSLSAGYGLTYRPVSHLNVFPEVFDASQGPAPPVENSLGAQAERYITQSSHVDLTHALSRRVSLSAGFGTWGTMSEIKDRDLSTWSGMAGVGVALTKGFGLRMGYRYGSGRVGIAPDEPRIRTQSADIGLDFSKALSLTRRTTLSFGTGTAGFTDGNQTQYWLTGNARLNYQIGRTWHTGLSFTRDVRFVETFRQPVFSDGLWAGFGGLVSRRLRFDSGVGASLGGVGLANESNRFSAYYSSAGLGFALSRYLNSGVRYSYSRYRFDNSVDLPLDLRFQSARHGVNVYVSAFVPLMQRTRRP